MQTDVKRVSNWLCSGSMLLHSPVVVLSPWLFGSVQPWAQLLCLVSATVAGLMALGSCLLEPPRRRDDVLFWSVMVVVGCAIFQLLPLQVNWLELLAPAVVEARAFFDPNQAAQALSAEPAATRLEVALLAGTAITFLTSSLAASRRTGTWALMAVLINGVLLSVVGLWQRMASPKLIYGFIETDGAPHGPFVNHNNSASYLLMCLACGVTLHLYYGENSGRRAIGDDVYRPVGSKRTSHARSAARLQLIILACEMVIVVGLMSSLSRGGVLALLCGCIVLFAIFATRENFRRSILAGTSVLAVSVVLLFTSGQLELVTSRLGGALNEGVLAGDGRLSIWAGSVSMIADYWLTGSGLGTFRHVFRLYDHDPGGAIATHAENSFLQILCEGGVVCFVLAVICLCKLFSAGVGLLQRSNAEAYAAGAGVVFLVVSQTVANCFDIGLLIPSNSYLFALLSGLVLGTAGATDSDASPRWSLGQVVFGRLAEGGLLALLCLAVIMSLDLMAASSLETPELGQRVILSSQPDTTVIAERLQRTIPLRWDDADGHFAIAESYIRQFDAQLRENSGGTFIAYAQQAQVLKKTGSENRYDAAVSEYLQPARMHLVAARQACCLLPHVHHRLFQLSFLDNRTDGSQDIARMLRILEGDRYSRYQNGLNAFEKGRLNEAFELWKPLLSDKSLYTPYIVKMALEEASTERLLSELFPEEVWFLEELATRYLTADNHLAERRYVQRLLQSPQSELEQ